MPLGPCLVVRPNGRRGGMSSGESAGGRGDAAPRARSEIVGAVVADLETRLAAPLPAGLHLVATPIGNLGDITLRAIAVLANADHVYCEDTRHSRVLLNHLGIERALRAYHEHNAEAERGAILALLAQGRSVAIISDAGTPLVSDPGYKLVREALAQGHAVTAVPGASAVLTALSVGGLPTDRFHFAGFLPAKAGQRRQRLEELADVAATLVLFEAPNRLAESLMAIAEVLGEARPVAVARELTKRFEEVRRGTAAEVAAWAQSAAVRGEVVVLVGAAEVADVSDADIEAALAELPETLSVRDATRTISEHLGITRSRAYAIALRLRSSRA
jgi:16S rRNA (cytidine1402-2'-O)-methyltransferase